jgi:hypothetical protein
MSKLSIDTEFEFSMDEGASFTNSLRGDGSSSTLETGSSFVADFVFGWTFDQFDCQCLTPDQTDNTITVPLPKGHRSLWKEQIRKSSRGRSTTHNMTPSSCSRTLSPMRRKKPVFIYEIPDDKPKSSRRERYKSRDRRSRRI